MIKPLTSLRFFFAFFVFLSHLSYLKENKNYKDLFEVFFSEGFLGVSFFFILSGFILALNYRNKFINKKITLKKFYIARLARIYPLHFITLLFSISAFYSGYKNLLYNALLLQSYIPNSKIFFSYNAPSWSISDEMFFYTLFPALVINISKLSKYFKILILAAFIFVVIFLNITLLDEVKAHYWLYISPFVRIFDFILGILLFEVIIYLKNTSPKLKQSLFNFLEIGGFIILVILLTFHDNIPVHYRFSIYYWLPMCMIILGASSSFIYTKTTTWTSKVLSWKCLVYLGEISFAFYMTHYLVLAYTNNLNWLIGLHPKNLSYGVEMFIITLVVSIFSFEFLEKPLNNKIKNLFP
ncbi:Peptidoglycan/LPS O-acetylase OafA/YrhL, contains acyltransferase and SGNH-hydrolase domains [Chryseobacterium taichungense]|uniref:Peptidoglycan/LPS O-acetylase OafA/YrhL, contains acyltransferase and SGNH-hydrolase domains n=1 Tax=Chryseobacterium taichungense TaxID=295069 RepID=A0A1H7ZIF9_9FLAO|nr:acyltransferase [Chryseobacterium taichungense]SEM57318.1 Peptidoglycan/LPS O-acetylase OafA/YrhL, contains acyltransferase and SGNH-hydrolase domains [Chryseobacterium taichungense]